MAKKKPANPPQKTLAQVNKELEQSLEASKQLLADKDALIKQMQQDLETAEENQLRCTEEIEEFQQQVEKLTLQIESDKGLKADPNPEIQRLKNQIEQYELAVRSKHQQIQDLTKELKLQTGHSLSPGESGNGEVVKVPPALIAQCTTGIIYGRRLDQVEKSATQIVNAAQAVAVEIYRRCQS